MIQVGGEAEHYLRTIGLTDTASSPAAWTILPFSARAEAALLTADPHPWAARFAAPRLGPGVEWLRPTAVLVANTTYPIQGAVGPVWAGRGGTVSVQGGVAGQWKAVRLQLAPIAFVTQNAPFPLAPNGETGTLQFADARLPRFIDLPQRFGESAYGRVDAGSSELSVEMHGGIAGISNAPQRWGPAREYPLVLGPNAGGFPHAFLGTAQPVDLWVARAQLQLIAGRLAQSPYSPAAVDRTRRVATALVISLSPRGLDGLELGATRFFDSTEPMTLRRIFRPLDLRALVGAVGDPTNDVNVANENQIASVFFRWVFPRAGVGLHGEWYREDFPGDFRKLVLKPDDLSSFMVGFERVFVSTPVRRRLIRVEIVNGELSHQERGQRGFTAPIPPYVHSEVRQGHTQRGLLLGSPEAYGGGGMRIAVDDYTPRGRVTIGVEQALRGDWLPGDVTVGQGVHPDMLYAVRGEVLRFVGGRDYTLVVLPAIDLNRNLVSGANRMNLNVSLRVAGW